MSSRPSTAERRNPDGTTTVTVKRACNSCGRTLGDATEQEIAAAVEGRPLSDVADECGCRTSQPTRNHRRTTMNLSTLYDLIAMFLHHPIGVVQA